MKVHVNLDHFIDLAVTDIGKQVPAVGDHFGDWELMAVPMRSGSVLVAARISSINHRAPPTVYIRGKSKHRVNNQEKPFIIVRRLRPACKSKDLPEAVRLLKAALRVVSKPGTT